MSLPGTVLLQTAPQGSELSPDWVFSLFMLLFASSFCALVAIFGLFVWGASKVSGGPRRKRRRDRGGTWVAVPHDDLWIHFPGPEDAHDPHRSWASKAPLSRPGPCQADLWDEP